MITRKRYDHLNRLTVIESVPMGPAAPALPFRYEYRYNSANQRIRMILADGTYWKYDYDDLGQLISGINTGPMAQKLPVRTLPTALTTLAIESKPVDALQRCRRTKQIN